jgi:hypothetical protein
MKFFASSGVFPVALGKTHWLRDAVEREQAALPDWLWRIFAPWLTVYEAVD